MTKTITKDKTMLVLAFAATFIAGAAVFGAISDYEAEAKPKKDPPGQDGTLEEIKNEVRNILGNVTSPLFGLEEIKNEVQTILTDVGIIKTTVGGIDTEVTNIEGKLDNTDTGLAAIKTAIDGIEGGTGGIPDSTQTQIDNIESDLQVKKSFYEVEDVVNVDVGPNLAGRSILVELNCPNTIPADKQAFNIQSLGARTHNVNATGSPIIPTNLFFNKTIIDGNFDTIILVDQSSTNLLVDAELGTLAASDKISFDYYLNGNNKIKAVAVGQMPQGCNVTIDADAPVVRTIEPLGL